MFPCPLECGKQIQFSVCLRNSPNPRMEKLALTVSAVYLGSYTTMLGKASIIGDVLKSEGEPRIFSSVNESSNYPNAKNTISVTLRSNIELNVCSTIWLISLYCTR
mmetsp:Transcript_40122/g.83916  ORF Transcript_40122/g.83916 Transcript_40122/m.83916 type:complete len:106 (-) Transcript_40122:3-320(-)